MNQLEEIGILEVEKNGAKRFKLNSNDERVLALGLIESNEFLRRSRKYELSFESSDVNLDDIKEFSNYNEIQAMIDEAPTLEFPITNLWWGSNYEWRKKRIKFIHTWKFDWILYYWWSYRFITFWYKINFI